MKLVQLVKLKAAKISGGNRGCAGRNRLALFWVFSVAALACLFAASAAHADTLNWNTRPATNLRTGGTDAAIYGSAPTLLTVTTSGATAGTFDAAGPNTLAIEPASTANGTTGYVNSTMNATVDDESSQHITNITFTEPVYNASVVVGDIDGGPTFNLSGAAFNDIVEFRAISVTGATILPTSGVPVNAAIVTWDSATGRALSTNQNVTTNAGDVTVTFAGPIRQLIIRHISGANSTVTNPTQQFVYIETVNFTRSPQLTVQKTSTGGTGTFTFTRSNVLNTATAPWSATTNASNITTVTAGTPVSGSPVILFAIGTDTTITESGAPAWQISTTPATCTDSNSAVSGNPASFTAAVSGGVATVASTNVRAGAIITCSIVNSLKPVLTLVKTVTNDNGGTAVVSAFTLTATGPSSISGASGTASVTSVPVTVGTYALSETGPSGYTASAWSCTAGTLSGSNLTLTYNQTATCTINNNDIAPTLQLAKAWGANALASNTANIGATSGGSANTSAFTAAGGTAATSNTVSVTIGNTITFPAETFTPVASAANYTTVLSCTAGGGATANALSGSNGQATNTLVIGAGDIGKAIVCTYTNTRKNTTFRLAKAWGTGNVTGNVASLGATTGLINNTALFTSTAPSATNGTFVTVYAGETATLPAETMTTGTLTNYVTVVACSGGTLTGTNGQTAGNTLAITAASTAAAITCTYTNTHRPKVSVQKITTGNFGGPFSFASTNLATTPANISTAAVSTATPASPTKHIVSVTGNAVSLTESFSTAWISSGVVCTDANSALTGNSNPVATSTTASITIPAGAVVLGADVNCVFTNAAAAPTLTILKQANTAGPVIVGQVITYTFRVKNTGNVPVVNVGVSDSTNAKGSAIIPGSEIMFADAAPLSDSSDASANGTWDTLAPGDEIVFSAPYTVVQADIDLNQ